jgi:type-F conjugative transfer system pilin assembly thiol-disulfide isomerase TrbB
MKHHFIFALCCYLVATQVSSANFLEKQLAHKINARDSSFEVADTQVASSANGSPSTKERFTNSNFMALKAASDPFFKNHALIFFFSSRCPYCRQFSPVVASWAKTHGANILGLTFDDQPLEGIPNVHPATTEWVNKAYNGKPITYPALFVVNESSHLLYPVVFGAMNDEELEARFVEIKSKINAYERRGA